MKYIKMPVLLCFCLFKHSNSNFPFHCLGHWTATVPAGDHRDQGREGAQAGDGHQCQPQVSLAWNESHFSLLVAVCLFINSSF